MSLSRAERRKLAQIGELLASEHDLIALEALFPRPARKTDARVRARAAVRRYSFNRVVAGLVAVALSVGAACALAEVDNAIATAAGTVLVVLSGLVLFLALRGYPGSAS